MKSAIVYVIMVSIRFIDIAVFPGLIERMVKNTTRYFNNLAWGQGY